MKDTNRRVRGRVRATVRGQLHTFELRQAGLCLRKWKSRKVHVVTFQDLLDLAIGQRLLPI